MAEPTPALEGYRVLAHGAGFVEGPVAQVDFIDFVSINRGLVYRARLDGAGCTVRAEVGGGPNGAAADARGRLGIVQNAARAMATKSGLPAEPGVQVVDVDATIRSPLVRNDLCSPNDCAFGSDGRLWFTDPYGRLMPDPPGDPQRAGGHGRVWAWQPESGDLEL